MTDPAEPQGRRRGLFQLVADLPGLVVELVQREIDLVKAEVIGKLKALGVGAGLLAGAVIAVLFVVGFLLLAATFALALVMPAWAAALVVAGVLLVVAVVLGLVGYRILKRGMPPLPTETLESLRSDLSAIKGIGDFDRFIRRQS